MKRSNRHHYIIHATGIAGIIIILVIKIFWEHLLPGHQTGRDSRMSEEMLNLYAEPPATASGKSTVPSGQWTSATASREKPMTGRQEKPVPAPGERPATGRQSENHPDRGMESAAEPGKSSPGKYNPATHMKIELNTADSAELVKLYGIGPYYAVSIMKYREKLGGFAIPEQLLEVKGMDSERLEGFYDRVFADTSFISKMDLKTATEDQLAQHLYIGRYLARCIVRYRETAGVDSCTLEHLVRDKVLTGEQAVKIGWYLY